MGGRDMKTEEAKTPVWTPDDFEKLLNLSFDDDLVGHLLDRPVDEVVRLRHGIHAYHLRGKDVSMLSSMMIQRLRKGGFTCPLCGGKS